MKIETSEKKCSKCGVILTDLNWPLYNKEHPRYRCRECTNKNHRKYYQSPEKKLEKRISNHKWRVALREEVIKAYGSKCACCGESDWRFLTLDHINNDGNSHRKKIGSRLYTWLKHNKFPQIELQVLCWNCNRAKFEFGGKCPHKSEEIK